MSTLTIPLLDAKELAKAIVPHASKDNVTPVLTYAVVGGKFGSFVYASDRYSIGRFDLTNVIIGDVPEDVFFIPTSALSALGTLGPATLPDNMGIDGYRVEFSRLPNEADKSTFFQATVIGKMAVKDAEPLDVPVWMRTWRVSTTPGNFPDTVKLFNQFVPSETERVHLGADQVAKFTGYARSWNHRNLMRITMSAPQNERTTGIVLVEIGRRFKGLVQQHVVFDETQWGADLAAENKDHAEHEAALAEATGGDS